MVKVIPAAVSRCSSWAAIVLREGYAVKTEAVGEGYPVMACFAAP
jgi:hypothetical protein